MRFRRPSQPPGLFPIQSDGRFGNVDRRRGNVQFGEAFGEGPEFQGSEGHFLRKTIPLKRFRRGAAIVLVTLLFFSGRAGYLQIYQGASFRAKAEGNRFRTHVVAPARGLVYDRKGTLLVENVPAFVLTMTIADLPDDAEQRSEELNRVAELAGVNRTDIDLLISAHASNSNTAIPIKRGLDYESALRLAIAIADLPGFHLETAPKRAYDTQASSLSHVLGYTGNISQEEYAELKQVGYLPTEDVGKAGVEKSAERLLRGTPGQLTVEVDSLGNEMSLVSEEDPVPGANITLSIDAGLQAYAESRLVQALQTSGATKGAIVAIDPRTGGVRALVSLPTFDSNAFSSGIDADVYANLVNDPNLPLFPRAISGEYPSGSTFKPFVAYTALAEGVVEPSTSFVSAGGLSVGGSFFPDWKGGGHGVTDVRKAIAESVNTYFYIVGGGYDNFTGLGVDRITAGARLFGFGSQNGIDLPGEADGFLPSKEWKQDVKGERWYVGDTYHLAIGQGDLLATPLQIATGTAIIANGGQRIRPHVVDGIDGAIPSGYHTQTPPEGEPLDADAIRVVREGMRQTVTVGSARSLSSLALPVAGKTGTAQAGGDRPNHAWFTGFGPYESPTLAVTILVEFGGEGSSTAVPIARDLFSWWFAHGGE